MSEKKHVIWSNRNLDIEDGWRDAYAEHLEANNMNGDPENEDEVYEFMVKMNDEYLGDERMNLDIEFSQPIIAIADLGLWNGRFSGYKELGSNNIKDCLSRMNDYETWYVDELGDLRCESIHHDGTNFVLYRVFRDDVSEEQIENFKDKIYEGAVTQADIDVVTRRLGDVIAKVYGWEISDSKSVDEKIADAQDRVSDDNSNFIGKVSYEKE